MYNDKNKINSMYFKKKTKKSNTYIYLIVILTFNFFVFFNLIFKESVYIQEKNFVKNSIKNNLLPPKPKEKWKYIQKLERL